MGVGRLSYSEFRTGLTFSEVYQMIYGRKWKRRNGVIGKWREIKLAMYDEYLNDIRRRRRSSAGAILLLVAAGVAGICASGCRAAPMRVVSSGNQQVPVELVTTFDDCRVYRMEDGGDDIYIARCGVDASVSWTRVLTNGKATWVEHRRTITTNVGN